MTETFYGPDFNQLTAQDPDIAALLLTELARQRENLQLIASENFTSPAVLAASVVPRRGVAVGWLPSTAETGLP